MIPEMQQPNIRELFVGRYRLMYEVFEAKVEILAFIHGARDFAKWRKSLAEDAGSDCWIRKDRGITDHVWTIQELL